MTVELGRRGLLRLLGAAPMGARMIADMVAKGAATSLAATRLAENSFGGPIPVPAGYGYHMIANNPKLFTLWKAGLLPEWAKREFNDDVANQTRYQMHSDVVALRSVSTSAKHLINERRHREKAWGGIDERWLLNQARNAFFDEGEGNGRGGNIGARRVG
jgi:hypothetical protein